MKITRHSLNNAGNASDLLLASLKEILGTFAFEALVREMRGEYLGEQMDIHDAVIYRPDLFERALTSILVEIGERPLVYIWQSRISLQLDICVVPKYEKSGDLANCMEALLAKGDESLR